MMDKRAKRSFIWLILLLGATIWIVVANIGKDPYRNASGLVFDTVYNITYQSGDSLKSDIENAFKEFDGSLSMFNDTSIITKINRNKPVKIDSLFRRCFTRSIEVSQQTGGDFDVTVCPLVNAWGFGFKARKFPSERMIDSLKKIVGYQKIKLSGNTVVKTNPQVMIDFSAIAKGYAVDHISYLLVNKGVKNFMVDIGGEVVVKGKNPQNKPWRIGINKPIDDFLSVNNSIKEVLYITDRAIATSGNYRNFYYYKGKKYSHEINPHTGYPALNEVLSATVIAPDCITADAMATSFMVMGLKKTQAFLKSHTELDAYIIYRDNKGKEQIWYSKGIDKYLNKE